MFGLFKKKTQMERLIAQDGIELVTTRFAEIIARKIPTKAIAYQFIIQELDGASRGNTASKRFAELSGIAATAYRDALENSNADVDGPDGPQQLLLSLSMDLARDPILMAEFRCKVDDKIMQKFQLGKYASEPQELPDSASNDLNDMLAAFMPQNDEDIKRGAAQFLWGLVQSQGTEGTQLSLDDMRQLVDNVSANIGDADIKNAGPRVLALSCLTSVTANAIDEGELAMANMYFACVNMALEKHFKPHIQSFDAYQKAAIQMILKEYQPVVQELEAANGQ